MEYSSELRSFICEKLPKKNDYSFIPQNEFEEMVASLIELEDAYIESVTPDGGGDIEYDDDAAFDSIFEQFTKRYEKYKTYCMAMIDDYLELSEEFMTAHGEIEWT